MVWYQRSEWNKIANMYFMEIEEDDEVNFNLNYEKYRKSSKNFVTISWNLVWGEIDKLREKFEICEKITLHLVRKTFTSFYFQFKTFENISWKCIWVHALMESG